MKPVLLRIWNWIQLIEYAVWLTGGQFCVYLMASHLVLRLNCCSAVYANLIHPKLWKPHMFLQSSEELLALFGVTLSCRNEVFYSCQHIGFCLECESHIFLHATCWYSGSVLNSWDRERSCKHSHLVLLTIMHIYKFTYLLNVYCKKPVFEPVSNYHR